MSSNNICTRVTDTFVSFYDWIFSCRRVAFTFKQSELTKAVQEKIEKIFYEARSQQQKPMTETYKSKIRVCAENCKNSSEPSHFISSFELETSSFLSSYSSSGRSLGAVWGSLTSKEGNNKIGQMCAKDPSVQYVSLTCVSNETALMLSKNESITYLDLSLSLDLDDTTAQELAKSTTLTYLNLGVTNVTNKGLKAFLNNTTLVALVLPFTPETEPNVRFFNQRLLKKLDNRIKQNIQTNTWKMIASLIAFQRANQDHPFKDSILSLLSKGGDLRKMIQSY